MILLRHLRTKLYDKRFKSVLYFVLNPTCLFPRELTDDIPKFEFLTILVDAVLMYRTYTTIKPVVGSMQTFFLSIGVTSGVLVVCAKAGLSSLATIIYAYTNRLLTT